MATSEHSRVVVIGSGPCGAMAAHALVRQGVPVTMLESGIGMPAGFLLRMMGRNFFRRVPAMRQGPFRISAGDPQTNWFCCLALDEAASETTDRRYEQSRSTHWFIISFSQQDGHEEAVREW